MESAISSYLKWPDYLVLVSFLVISLAIGLYHSLTGGRQKTTAEFIMANRRLQVLPTSISLLVSFQSAILVLGLTAEMYGYGAQMLLFQGFSFIANAIVVERIFIPWLYPLQLISVNEYIERRFQSKSVRIFTSFLGILTSVLYMATAMYAPSAALQSATGFPMKLSIPLMSLVCVSYTALGGMRAVIWTDVFQFLTMIGGLLAVLILGVIEVGGVKNVIRYAGEEGRLNLVDWNPDPTERHTFWNIMIGGTIGWIPAYGLSQASIQRFSATRSLSKARLTILLNIPGVCLIEFMAGFTGLVVLAYYAKIQCDPLLNKDISNANQLLPHMVMTIFSAAPGFAGLFLATLYGGALSSVSSALSGSAANCWEDILQLKLKHLPETKKAIINRILVVIFGVLACALSFLAAALPGPITQVSVALTGSIIGPLFGIFMLGGLSRHANKKGALIGGFVALFFILFLSIGAMSISNKYPELPPVSTNGCPTTNLTSMDINNNSVLVESTAQYNINNISITAIPQGESQSRTGLERFYCISYLWYCTIGLLITLIVGTVASLIFRDKEAEKAVDEKLLINFRNLYSCSDDHSDNNEQRIATETESPAKKKTSENSLNGVEKCTDGLSLPAVSNKVSSL